MRVLLLTLALGGCAAEVGSNYTPPAQCRGDLSYVKAPVVRIAPAIFAQVNRKATPQIGAYLPPNAEHPNGLIFVDSTLSANDAAKVVAHERCHAVAGNWHP